MAFLAKKQTRSKTWNTAYSHLSVNLKIDHFLNELFNFNDNILILKCKQNEMNKKIFSHYFYLKCSKPKLKLKTFSLTLFYYVNWLNVPVNLIWRKTCWSYWKFCNQESDPHSNKGKWTRWIRCVLFGPCDRDRPHQLSRRLIGIPFKSPHDHSVYTGEMWTHPRREPLARKQSPGLRTAKIQNC